MSPAAPQRPPGQGQGHRGRRPSLSQSPRCTVSTPSLTPPPPGRAEDPGHVCVLRAWHSVWHRAGARNTECSWRHKFHYVRCANRETLPPVSLKTGQLCHDASTTVTQNRGRYRKTTSAPSLSPPPRPLAEVHGGQSPPCPTSCACLFPPDFGVSFSNFFFKSF